MNRLKFYSQLICLVLSIKSYTQIDSAKLDKKLTKAQYWLPAEDLKELKDGRNLYTNHKLKLDSFNLMYDNAFDKLEETLDSLDAIKRKQKTHFTLSNLFESTVNYKGRIVDKNQPGNVLSILAETPIGLNIYVAENYWSHEKNPFALTELGVGYEKEFLDYFTASIDYERWIFTNGPKKERKSLSNFAALSLNFESEHVYANAMYSYVWGTANANAINLDLAYVRRFNFVKKIRAVEVRPTTTFIAGNPNYSLNYFKSIKKNITPPATTTTNETSFLILDYEASLALIAEWKKIKLTAEQHFAFPVNGSINDPVVNFNYFTFQIDYTFGTK